MKTNTNKAFSQILSIGLIIALLLPYGFQFSHILSSHEHEICDGETSHHFHGEEFNCDLDKYKTSIDFVLPLFVKNQSRLNRYTTYNNRYKSLISSSKESSKNLRAPPVQV